LLPPIPDGDRSVPGFAAALGAVSCPQNHPGDNNFRTPSGSQNVACDGSNISPVALRILNIKLPNGQYYIPGSGVAGYKQATFTSPAIYNGNQGLVNFDYLVSSKHTVSRRWFYSDDTRSASVGGQLPGAPNFPDFSNTNAVLKLTSIVTDSIINEGRISYQRNLSQTVPQAVPGVTNSGLGITPNVPGVDLPPPFAISASGFTILGGI